MHYRAPFQSFTPVIMVSKSSSKMSLESSFSIAEICSKASQEISSQDASHLLNLTICESSFMNIYNIFSGVLYISVVFLTLITVGESSIKISQESTLSIAELSSRVSHHSSQWTNLPPFSMMSTS